MSFGAHHAFDDAAFHFCGSEDEYPTHSSYWKVELYLFFDHDERTGVWTQSARGSILDGRAGSLGDACRLEDSDADNPVSFDILGDELEMAEVDGVPGRQYL